MAEPKPEKGHAAVPTVEPESTFPKPNTLSARARRRTKEELPKPRGKVSTGVLNRVFAAVPTDGARAEEIIVATRLPPREVKLALAWLKRDGQVEASGRARAMTYRPAGLEDLSNGSG
jgi:hypothetical protein